MSTAPSHRRGNVSPSRRATILVVGGADNVHTVSWLKAARNDTVRLVLIPATYAPFPQLEEFVAVTNGREVQSLGPDCIGVWTLDAEDTGRDAEDSLPPPLEFADRGAFRRGAAIVRAIRALGPDLLHSLELQIAGYSCLSAARLLREELPPWVVSNRGDGLFLYAKLRRHLPILQEILSYASAYVGECCRDMSLARQLGFAGIALSTVPTSDGTSFESLPLARPPSQRRDIIVNGDDGWSGRCPHILSALHLARAELRDFHIRVLFTSPSVEAMTDALRREDGLTLTIERCPVSHADALRRLAEARISISLGIGGGIDTNLLESMSVGTFPIASNATCAAEWISSGRDGFIVDPHDIAALAHAIGISMTDDLLVDGAVKHNQGEVSLRCNADVNSRAIQNLYKRAMNSGILRRKKETMS